MIMNVLTGIAVSNIQTSKAWYSKLLGWWPEEPHDADAAQWEFAEGGWLQIYLDKQRAGASSFTLVTAGIEDEIEDLKSKGIRVDRKADIDGFAKSAVITDPDGNRIMLLQTRHPSNMVGSWTERMAG